MIVYWLLHSLTFLLRASGSSRMSSFLIRLHWGGDQWPSWLWIIWCIAFSYGIGKIQHFQSTLGREGRGHKKEYSVCTFLIMLTIMEDPLADHGICRMSKNISTIFLRGYLLPFPSIKTHGFPSHHMTNLCQCISSSRIRFILGFAALLNCLHWLYVMSITLFALFLKNLISNILVNFLITLSCTFYSFELSD